MPWTMRSVHAVELLFDSLAYGGLLAIMLMPRKPAHNFVSAEETSVRKDND